MFIRRLSAAVVSMLWLLPLLASSVAVHAAPPAELTVDTDIYSASSSLAIGGFEFETAPLYVALARSRTEAAFALNARRITVSRAQDIQTQADHIRYLLDASVIACAPDSNTDECTGDESAARKLLADATAALSTLEVPQ